MENCLFTAFVRSCTPTEFTTNRGEVMKGFNVQCEDDNHHFFYVWSAFQVEPTEIVKIKMSLKWHESTKRYTPSFKAVK